MNRCLLNVSNDHYSSIQCWPSVALSRTPSSRAASAKFNLSMSRIYGWTETSWVRRTCRTTTYLRTSTATMSCVVYFSFLHYMFWLWYFWCMLLSKINATIYVYKGSNWGSRTFQGNASKPSKRRVPRPKVGFGALERVQYSLSVCGDSRGHIGESWV